MQINNMFKKIITTILVILAGLSIYSITTAASFGGGGGSTFSGGLFDLNGNGVVPKDNRTLGTSANRISKIWADSLDATNIEISGASAGDLPMGGFDITDGGQITGTHFTATSTTADTNLHNNTLYVDSSTSRVGIRTDTPNGALDVFQGSSNSSRFSRDTSQYVRIDTDAGANAITSFGVKDLVFNNTDGVNAIVFQNSSNETARFDFNGNVGIGTSSPATLLDIFSTATTTIKIDSNSVTQGGCLKIKDIDGVGYSYGTSLAGVITWSTVSCE